MICTCYLAKIPLVIFQNCLKLKLRITISKYHSWYLCQISLQIMLLPIQIFCTHSVCPQDFFVLSLSFIVTLPLADLSAISPIKIAPNLNQQGSEGQGGTMLIPTRQLLKYSLLPDIQREVQHYGKIFQFVS